MVERQLGRRKLPAAVLAAVAVAKIDVAARKLHFLARKSIEGQELNDVRDQDLPMRRRDVMIGGLNGDIHPVLEVVRPVLGIDSSNVALVKQDQRTAYRGDLHGLKNPVENQYVPIEH